MELYPRYVLVAPPVELGVDWLTDSHLTVVNRFPRAVVGEDEMTNRSVNIRSRDETQKGRSETMSLEDAMSKLLTLKETKGAVSKLE